MNSWNIKGFCQCFFSFVCWVPRTRMMSCFACGQIIFAWNIAFWAPVVCRRGRRRAGTTSSEIFLLSIIFTFFCVWYSVYLCHSLSSLVFSFSSSSLSLLLLFSFEIHRQSVLCVYFLRGFCRGNISRSVNVSKYPSIYMECVFQIRCENRYSKMFFNFDSRQIPSTSPSIVLKNLKIY